MAKRYALVPEAWLTHHASTRTSQQNTHMDPNRSRSSSSVPKEPSSDKSPTVTSPGNTPNELEQLLEMVPKTYRHKAKVFLNYVMKHISLDDQQRVIYDDEDNNDESVGSNIIDIVRYFVSPYPAERPLDAPRFQEVVEKSGVPMYTLHKRKTLLRTSVKDDSPFIWNSLMRDK